MNQVLDCGQLVEGIRGVAADIERDFRADLGDQDNGRGNSNVLVVIGVLSGGVFFAIDLVRSLKVPTVLGWVRIQTYQGTSRRSDDGAKADLLLDRDFSLYGRDVLVVDDILDTGFTMRVVVEQISRFDPRSIKTAVLLRKPSTVPRIDIDHVAFDITDTFVVGWGMDRDGRYRDLPGIWTI
jgi:hypoxanthine phosphoribosyltransferase